MLATKPSLVKAELVKLLIPTAEAAKEVHLKTLDRGQARISRICRSNPAVMASPALAAFSCDDCVGASLSTPQRQRVAD